MGARAIRGRRNCAGEARLEQQATNLILVAALGGPLWSAVGAWLWDGILRMSGEPPATALCRRDAGLETLYPS